MALWLIIAGIMLLGIAGYLKYLIYTETEETSILPTNKLQEQMQNKLENISNDLTQIIDDINEKQNKIRESVARMDIDNLEQYEAELRRSNRKSSLKNLLNNIDDDQYISHKDEKKSGDNFQQVLTQQCNNEDSLSYIYRRVFNLSQQGQSVAEIAERMDLGVRETELILKFNQRKADNNDD